MLDLLVVGGGPAGAATAIHAALAGLSVRVLEPRPIPVDKACGEGLMPCGLRMLRSELGVSTSGMPFHGIRYRDDRASVTARFSSGPGLGVRRTELSRALHDRLQQLGVPVHAERAERVAPSSERVEINDMTARWLVAADGLHSPIRRQLGLALPRPERPRRFGLRRHFATPPWTDVVEVHWAERSEAYVTPLPDGVGVAILTAERGPFDRQLARFPELQRRLAGHEASTTLGAGPFAQRVRHRAAGRVRLVGDAAGYVDALTGEGLSVAFASARELMRCLHDGDDYDRAWMRITRTYRMLTSGLLWARDNPVLRPRVVPTTARLPGLFDRAVRALAD